MKKDAPYYIQQGLKKLRQMVGKDAGEKVFVEEKAEQSVQVKDIAPETDYISWRQTVRDSVVRQLSSIARNTASYPDKSLKVYIDDEKLFVWAAENRLDGYLDDWIENSRGHRFHSVTLCQGEPPAGVLQARVDAVVSIGLERRPVPVTEPAEPVAVVPTRAAVSVVDGCCVLDGGVVELIGDTERSWNIGFAAFNNFGGQQVRRNEIALQYAAAVGRENDPYPVSRAHAHIRYKPGRGYVFFVDPRGLGKRTAVQKGERVHKVTDTRTGIILEDGDYIILNREILLFTCLND